MTTKSWPSWSTIRLTQIAWVAGVLTYGGSNALGCWETMLVAETSGDNDSKLNPCLKNLNTHHLDICAVWGFQNKQRHLCYYHTFITPCISARLPPTPSTSFDKCSWITWDGPKGQGPESLSAWLSKTTGKHSVCSREQVDFPLHKRALFLHMWRLIIRIIFFFIVAPDKLVCLASFS